VNEAVFEASCAILEKFLRPLDDSYLDEQDEVNYNFDKKNIAIGGSSTISPLEWELLSTVDIFSSGSLPPNAPV
jgi:hypothetical protein